MAKLNKNELVVFSAIRSTIRKETGGQFGWADNIKVNIEEGTGLTLGQIAGYCAQLEKKGLYCPFKDGKDTMIMLTDDGVELARELGDDCWYETV